MGNEFPFHFPHGFDSHVVDAELLGISYELYTAQVKSNIANARLKAAEARFQDASSRDPTFVSRSHLCYDVFAQLERTSDFPHGGLPSPSPSFSELYTPTDAFGHGGSGDFDYVRFAEAFEHMFPGAATASQLKPCIAPTLLYSPSPPASNSPPPHSYGPAALPPVFGGIPVDLVKDEDELAALGLAMFAGGYSASAMAAEAPEPLSSRHDPVASTSAPKRAKRPSLSRRPHRPRSESADSGRGQKAVASPTAEDAFRADNSLPSPGGTTGSEDDAEIEIENEEDDDEADEDEFPREIAYDPNAVFASNEKHMFFLVTTRELPELSERCCLEIFLRNATPDELTLESVQLFVTEDGDEWSLTFASSGVVVTPLRTTVAAQDANYTFAHFPPGTMTCLDHLPVGSLAWWRIQACSGPTKHRGMPGRGDWTARFDANPKDRRPARIVHHFSDCRHRQSPDDALGSFARSILGISLPQ
ncbi:hypothetical protein RQP46_007822 [Phenoliferia psychrophenolica]